jgi:hypothetical protein
MSFPFKETKLDNNQYIREFEESVDSDELEWHRDREDRIVEIIQNDGWEFQLDNELPVVMTGSFFVPKETYHRVIKGNGQLIVKITKLV